MNIGQSLRWVNWQNFWAWAWKKIKKNSESSKQKNNLESSKSKVVSSNWIQHKYSPGQHMCLWERLWAQAGESLWVTVSESVLSDLKVIKLNARQEVDTKIFSNQFSSSRFNITQIQLGSVWVSCWPIVLNLECNLDPVKTQMKLQHWTIRISHLILTQWADNHHQRKLPLAMGLNSKVKI